MSDTRNQYDDPSSNTRIARMQEPLGNTKIPTPVYFTCTKLHHKMIRPDGKPIIFLYGVHKASIKQDIDYLEKEILEGPEFLRHSTDQEIEFYEMRVDPKGHLSKTLRPQLEEQVRNELEVELRKKLAGKVTQDQLEALFSSREEELLSGVSSTEGKKAEKIEIPTGTVTINRPTLGGIVGTDKVARA